MPDKKKSTLKAAMTPTFSVLIHAGRIEIPPNPRTGGMRRF